jgi:protein-S-isoprenylcysteine O-methyltransferase Ste14
MPELALVCYGVFGVLAFGLRSAMQYIRTGSTGFRGFSGAPGSLEWWAGRGFTLALVAVLMAPIADLAGWLPRMSILDQTSVAFAGLAIAIIGTALVLVAQVAMGDSWRIGVDENERTALVTHGVFSLVRNPIFSSMFIVVAGLALMVPNVLSAAGLVALVAAVEAQVRLVEEPYLIQSHGMEYRAYAAKAGRFVPLVGRLRS